MEKQIFKQIVSLMHYWRVGLFQHTPKPLDQPSDWQFFLHISWESHIWFMTKTSEFGTDLAWSGLAFNLKFWCDNFIKLDKLNNIPLVINYTVFLFDNFIYFIDETMLLYNTQEDQKFYYNLLSFFVLLRMTTKI